MQYKKGIINKLNIVDRVFNTCGMYYYVLCYSLAKAKPLALQCVGGGIGL
jgi:hypothetical protein